ncbi:YHYH domain-containing protein [Microvirga guangxiensis]|nr:YHYH domain-containing protein [Microvirga guangxiensis]
MKALFAGLLASLVATAALGHPGGLNKDGCHNNRKTGDYHCHR